MSTDQLDSQVDEWLSAGCAAVKLKIGEDRGRDVGRDLDRVARVVSAVHGRADVMVDANGGYARGQAARIGHDLDILGVTWFEEPVSSEDLRGLGRLRDVLGCEIAAGEYIAEVSDARAVCEAVNWMSPGVGGYTGWRRCAAYAHAAHVPVSAQSAPALHLPLAVPDHAVRHAEWFSDHVALEEKLVEGTPVVATGDCCTHVRRSPAMGID